jgi:hypothetical protein
VVAALVGAGFLYLHSTFAGLFFLMMAIQNYTDLQHRRAW